MKHTPGLTHNFSAQLLQYYKDNSPDANKNQQPNDEQISPMKSSQPLQCVGENNIREVIIAPNVIVYSNEQLEELKTNCIGP